MAVTVILALVAGTAAVGLAGVSGQANVESMAARLRDLDVRARLLARAEGPVLLAVVPDEGAVVLVRVERGERLAAAPVLPDVTVWIESDTPGSITMDRAGRSADYVVAVRGETHTRRWRVNGLSGVATAEREP